MRWSLVLLAFSTCVIDYPATVRNSVLYLHILSARDGLKQVEGVEGQPEGHWQGRVFDYSCGYTTRLDIRLTLRRAGGTGTLQLRATSLSPLKAMAPWEAVLPFQASETVVYEWPVRRYGSYMRIEGEGVWKPAPAMAFTVVADEMKLRYVHEVGVPIDQGSPLGDQALNLCGSCLVAWRIDGSALF